MTERLNRELRPIRFICSSCNDFLTLNDQDFNLLLERNKGKAETICTCGGTMVLLEDTRLRDPESRKLPGNNSISNN